MLKMVSHSKSAMSENARNVHEMEMREALCFCSDKIKKMSFEGNFFFFSLLDLVFVALNLYVFIVIFTPQRSRPSTKSRTIQHGEYA